MNLWRFIVWKRDESNLVHLLKYLYLAVTDYFIY